MKIILKKLLIASTILLAFTFSSCEKDLYEEAIITNSSLTSERISFSQLNSEINNPLLKSFINNELKNQLGLSESRTSADDYFKFLKIIKSGEYTTYTLTMNKYTEQKPYFLSFIITKEGALEKAGYYKYIPDNPELEMDPENLNGRIQVFDLEDNMVGETEFISSIPQVSQSVSCSTSYSVVTHNCSNGGNHAPGESCSSGYYNDGYYEIIATVICNWNPSVTYLAAPTAFMGAPSGGDGGIYSYNTNVFQFLLELTEEEYNLVRDYPEIITYLEENDASPDSKNFIREVINQILQNPDVFTSIKPFLIEKEIDDSQLDDCTKGILNQLKSNHAIAEIIARFKNPTNLFAIHLNQAVIPINPDGSVTYGQTSTTNINLNYNITLNSNYFNDTGATKLGKAKTMIHEILHALIFSVIENANSTNNNDINDFPAIWNTYVAGEFNGDTNTTHHLFIGNNYVSVISKALQELDTGNPVPENTEADQIYRDLAWGGLFKLFNPTSPFDAVLDGNDKARIYNRNLTEMQRSTSYGMTPTSNSPCEE